MCHVWSLHLELGFSSSSVHGTVDMTSETSGLPLSGLHYHTNPFCIEVASIEVGKTKVNVSGGKLLSMAETNKTVPQLAPVL